ncbi:MAG TPA: lipid-binding SYLF domain-containing protein [Terriglobales bacterium]|nr:lipid-binding SYLF domain-containing protein [Terriglobales bacterium]
MQKLFAALMSMVLLGSPAFAQDKEEDRLQAAGEVMQEILGIPEGIPQELLDKAECIIVLPSVKKLALGIGGSYGRGAMVCRTGANFSGPWSSPVMMALEGGSWGLQIGGEATDFVLLMMNPRAANAVLRSKVKLGANATAAAGPKGRSAQAATDASLRAEILTYSRSRGLFAGISLEGSTLRPDGGANENLYGRKVSARRMVQQPGPGAAKSASLLVTQLNQHSPSNASDAKSLQNPVK